MNTKWLAGGNSPPALYLRHWHLELRDAILPVVIAFGCASFHAWRDQARATLL